MAPMLAGRETNGFQPPPSSMLVTHVVHGNGVPDFDRDSFNQLLAEALGSDEQGQSNLGNDVSVNHKLICIIFQVGIERALEENPFQAATGAGKADSQLKTCLDVLQLAIERSPQVLFVKSDSPGSDVSGTCALYSWLIPRLVPLLAGSRNTGIHDSVLQVFNAMLESDGKCAVGHLCGAILEYMRATISGKFSYRLNALIAADSPSAPRHCLYPSQLRV